MTSKEKNSIKQGRKNIFVGEGLFEFLSTPPFEPRLIGSKCQKCGEVVFPKQSGCPNCCSEDVEKILLSPRGELASFTNINHAVPAGYRGPVPYGVGWVDLPEGVRITAYLTEHSPDKLKIGADMMMIVDKFFDDEDGNEVIGFKFKPL